MSPAPTSTAGGASEGGTGDVVEEALDGPVTAVHADTHSSVPTVRTRRFMNPVGILNATLMERGRT
jgi:hypothetical protein